MRTVNFSYRGSDWLPESHLFGRYEFARVFSSRRSVLPLIRRPAGGTFPGGEGYKASPWGSWQGEALTDEGGTRCREEKPRANSYTLTGKPLAFSCLEKVARRPDVEGTPSGSAVLK